MERHTGLILHHDENNVKYKFNADSYLDLPFNSKEWWDNGWWGDQEDTPHCNAFSWMHILADGPIFQDSSNPIFDTTTFHTWCKDIDGLSGKGTTLDAGARVLYREGYLKEYRWINTLDDLISAVLIHGPVIAGTHWYSGMDTPDSRGRIKASGSPKGGHAFIINGVDVPNKLFRIKNTYGKKWGKNGHAFLSFDDIEKLFSTGGNVCVPFVLKK